MLNMTHRGQHRRLYDTEIQKKEVNPSCIMLNMTHRGQHWRVYDTEIKKKGGKRLLYYVEYDTQRPTQACV